MFGCKAGVFILRSIRMEGLEIEEDIVLLTAEEKEEQDEAPEKRINVRDEEKEKDREADKEF